MVKYAFLAILICLDVCLILTKIKIQKGSTDYTVITNALYLEMLNPRNLNHVAETYTLPVSQLESTGISIARAKENARGDILLAPRFSETNTVGSAHHAVVAKDDEGYFIKNNHQNGIFLVVGKEQQQMDEIAIKGGEVIYLGNQPIRFREPKRPVPVGGLGERIMNKLLIIKGRMRGFSSLNRRTFHDDGNW